MTNKLIEAADRLADELEHIMEMHTLTYSSATEALTAYLTAKEGADNTMDIRAAQMDQIEKAVSESNWIPKEYHMNDAVSDACSFLRGDARESAGEVQVKPLVWEAFDAETAWAHSPFGTYRYNAPKLTLSTQKNYVGDGFGNWRMGSLEAAKAAAQADYETRIRSALAGG